MALAMHQISPVAHLPLVLGVVRKLNIAALIDTFCPPHPAHILSCGRGVEALLLAILDGHHALYRACRKTPLKVMGASWPPSCLSTVAGLSVLSVLMPRLLTCQPVPSPASVCSD